MVSSGKFKKSIGNVSVVKRLGDNRFAVALDSIPKISKKKKKSQEYVEKDVFIDSSNILLLQIGNN